MSLNTISKLSSSDKIELKNGVIEVHSNAMNRTALGIVDALIKLYPKATYADLKEMIPDTINPSAPKNYKSLFKPYSSRNYGVIQSGIIRKECEDQGLQVHASHFVEIDETFRSADNVEILVSKSWESKDTETGEKDLQNLIEHVSQFGVRVAELKEKKSFGKVGYQLEVVNPKLKEKLTHTSTLTFKWIIFVSAALIILFSILWYLFN